MHNVDKKFILVIGISFDSQKVEKHGGMWRGGGKSGILRGLVKVTDAHSGPKSVGEGLSESCCKHKRADMPS